MKLPAAAESTPITYADARGNQYVAVVATGGGLIGAPLLSDAVIAYSLAGTKPVSFALEEPTPTQSVHSAPLAASVGTALTSEQLDPVYASLLPPGPGRDLTLRVCGGCHSSKVLASQHMDAKGWNDMVQAMAGRGAVATDEEFDTISAYLARSFPKSASQAAPASQ